jgi:hypothetical protein
MSNLKNITVNEITSDDSINLLNSSKLHIICSAKKVGGLANTLLTKLGESQLNIDRYCDMVNSKYEPGCLFPKHTLTLFPVLRQDKQLSMQQDLRKFFGDTFEAQEKYFKSNKMIFCYDEQSWPDMALVKAILQEELINRPLEGVESISFHPF